MPLFAADCPLLPPDSPLPGLYAELEQEVQRAAGPLGPALDPHRVQAAAAVLADARDRLTRQRYRIGFLGPSGFGKSSTLNRVVRRLLASEGGPGKAATSTVTRFIPVPPGTPPQLTIEYMTSVQFQRRRYALARCIGGRVHDPTKKHHPNDAKTYDELAAENAKLIGLLEAEIEEHRQAAAAEDATTKIDARGDDRATLLRMLRAYQAHGRRHVLPGTEPDRQVVPLVDVDDLSAQLFKYTNHVPGGEPEAKDLIWQLKVKFPMDPAATTIELIDLPGIGTKRKGDDLTTLAFMHELDGALVFQRAGKSDDGVVGDIITALHGKPHPDWEFTRLEDQLKGRIWVVGTHADELNKNNLGQKGNYDATFLEGVNDEMEKYGIRHDRVRFVANMYYDELQALGPNPDRQQLAMLYRLKLSLPVKPDGTPDLPEKLDRHPVLKVAYQEVIKDGGIDRLREVITRELADEVRRRLCRQVGLKLGAAAEDLRLHIETTVSAGTFGQKEFEAAREWAAAAKYLAGDRYEVDPAADAADPRYRALGAKVEEAFRGVKRHLREQFARNSKTQLGDLRTQHAGDAENLAASARKLSAEAANAVFDWTAQQLAAFADGQPAVRVDDHPSPTDLLASAFREDRQTLTDWLLGPGGPVGRLADTVFFPSATLSGPARRFRFADYQQIMRLKTDAVVHELAHRVAGRARTRLRAVRDKLIFLATPKDARAAAVAREELTAAAARLQEIAARFDQAVRDLSRPTPDPGRHP